jgi:hypothetical protein
MVSVSWPNYPATQAQGGADSKSAANCAGYCGLPTPLKKDSTDGMAPGNEKRTGIIACPVDYNIKVYFQAGCIPERK